MGGTDWRERLRGRGDRLGGKTERKGGGGRGRLRESGDRLSCICWKKKTKGTGPFLPSLKRQPQQVDSISPSSST